MFGCKKKEYKEICAALNLTSGGIYKRIDENRELLELLASKHPEVLQNSPWIVGWIRANDEYFMAALHSMGMRFHRENPHNPRPFPIIETRKEL